MRRRRDERTEALAADRAFVVQFRTAPADRPLERLAGRVEHVHSGAVAHFESLDGLLDFLRRSLAAPSARAAAAGRPDGPSE